MMKHQSVKAVLRYSAVGILAVLGACATPTPSLAPTAQLNPIQISESVERMELYARPSGMELSARDQIAVSQFLSAYAQHGDGPLYVNVPARHVQTAGIQQTRAVISGLMTQNGLYNTATQEGSYQSAPGMPAPVIISYRRLKTLPQNCWSGSNLSESFSNQPYPQFGCAASNNLAAMVSNPRQLIEPYAMTPADTQRRSTVYDKYIAGESTASNLDDRQDVGVDE